MRTTTASVPKRALLGGIATLLLVVACSGASGSPSAPDGGTKSAAPATGAPPTSAAVAPSEPAAGGGTGAGSCELVTAAELAPIFKVPSVKTTLLAGPPDACILASDTGAPLGAWTYTTTGAKAVYDAITTSAVAVSGIGDKAAFVENTGLAVLKGDKMLVVSLSAGVSDLSQEEQDAIAKAIATIAAGRM